MALPETRTLTPRARLILLLVLFISGFMRFGQAGILGLDSSLQPVPLTTPDILGLLVAALNTAAAGLLWWIGWRQFNFTVALVAGLTLALNPWALALSHAEPLPGLLLPLLILAGALALADGQLWRVVGITAWVATLALAAILLPDTPLMSAALPENLIHMLAGTGTEMVITPDSAGALLVNVPRPDVIWRLFLGTAAALGLVALWFSVNRRAAVIIYGGAALALAGALIAPALILAVLPITALLTGAAVAWLIRLLPGGQLIRLVVLAAWAAILLSQAWWWRGALRYIELQAALN